MNKIRVFLTDDHTILRAGLKTLVDRELSLKVVGEASDGQALLDKLASISCDVVVLDLSMPHKDGIATLEAIRKRHPKIRVLILTMQKDPEHFKKAMDLGASGFVLKDDAYEQLIMAIKLVDRGKKFVSPSMASQVAERFLRSDDDVASGTVSILTPREKQVLKAVAQGLPNKNIATKFKISVRTVETHRANVCKKLGFRNTAQLVRFAIDKGLI